MAAVWLPALSELRRRWRSLVLLGLFGALVGSVVVGAVAGARRTSTAYDRLVDTTSFWDMEVALAGDGAIDAIRALPAVRSSWVGELDVGQVLDTEEVGYLSFISGPTREPGHHQPLVVEGRMFDPAADDEIVVSQLTAAFLGWDVGEVIDFGGLSPQQYVAFEQEQVPGTPAGDRVDLTVTGLVRDPNDALPFEFPRILASPGYFREHADDTGGLAMVSVRLDGGAAAVEAFREDVTALAGPDAIRSLRSHHELRATVDRATEVAARGLLIFAACAAVAGTVGLTQALNRSLLLRREELELYRALGFDRRAQLAALALPLAVIVVVSALGTVVGAALGSRFTPVGTGELVEPSPGMEVNVAALSLGALAVGAAATGLVLLASHHALRRGAGVAPARPSAVVRATLAVGAPVPWVVGTRLAVEPGRGRAALPTRSALGGLVLGVAGVVASLSVVASLDDLYASPERFGWNHDITVADVEPEVMTDLIENDGLAAVTEVRQGDVELEGRSVNAMFLAHRKSSIEETILDGRMPVGPGEVAIGPELADRVDVAIGDDVSVRGVDGPLQMRVVGIVLTESPGEFAGRAVFDAAALEVVPMSGGFTQAYLRIDPETDREAVTQQLAREKEISRPEQPASLLNLIQTRTVIRLLALFLALIGVGAIAHVLAVATARRRRELAVLRALGLTGRQLGLSIAAMTAVLIAAGLAFGIPGGLILASVTWRAMTSAMHLPGDVTVPLATLALLTVGSLVLGAVLAVGPAHRAATLPPSALRTE